MSEFQNIGKIEKRLDGTTWYDQDYVDNIQQELDRCVKANVILDKTNTNYASIIFDLEEWLKDAISEYSKYDTSMINVIKQEDKNVLDKIQELKEKYK